MEDEDMKRAVAQLDESASVLRKQGKQLAALGMMERALEMRARLHGLDSPEVHRATKEYTDALNNAALRCLQTEQLDKAFELLQKAEMLSAPDDPITAVTYNNFACYYRRQNKLRAALKYLEKALAIETRARLRNVPGVNVAGTELNLCVVLSQLGRHKKALDHAQSAVITLQDELMETASQQQLSLQLDSSSEILNKMAVLAISYHNLAVEHEFLQKMSAALDAYRRAVHIAKYYLGEKHHITASLSASLQSAQLKIASESDAKKRKQMQRLISRTTHSGSSQPMRAPVDAPARARPATASVARRPKPEWDATDSLYSAAYGGASDVQPTTQNLKPKRVQSAPPRRTNYSDRLRTEVSQQQPVHEWMKQPSAYSHPNPSGAAQSAAAAREERWSVGMREATSAAQDRPPPQVPPSWLSSERIRPSLESAPREAAYNIDDADQQVDALLSNRHFVGGGGGGSKETRAPSTDAPLPPRPFGSPTHMQGSQLAPHAASAASSRSRPTSASAVMQSHGRWRPERFNPQQYHDMISPRVGVVDGGGPRVAAAVRASSLSRPSSASGEAAKVQSLKYVMTPV